MSNLSNQQHRNVNREDVLGHFHYAGHLKILEPLIPFGKRKEPFDHTPFAQVVVVAENHIHQDLSNPGCLTPRVGNRDEAR